MPTSWLKNKNSKRWKQLEHILSHMPDEFSNKDIMNFLEYRWDTEGPKNREGRPQIMHHFNRNNISKFLASHKNIEKRDVKIKGINIYRKRK